jgi:Gly-Xaa carboxypeptidase
LQVGYLAIIIQEIENHPFKSKLSDLNPTTIFLKTAARYAKDMPKELKEAILDNKGVERVISYMDSSLDTRALIRTSTAVDVVRGGEKCPSRFSILDPQLNRSGSNFK